MVEINTYEQLRELDENSDQLKSDAMAEIERVLSVSGEEITGIELPEKGNDKPFVFIPLSRRTVHYEDSGGRYESSDQPQAGGGSISDAGRKGHLR